MVMGMNIIKNKFRGAFVGGAVGDSLGMCIEDLTSTDIKNYYGDKIRFLLKPHPKSPACNQEAGETSSEFQIVKLVTESLIEKGSIDIDHLIKRYIDFIETEEEHRYLDSHFIYAVNTLKDGYQVDRGGSSIEGALQSVPLGLYYYLRPQLAYDVARSVVSLTYKNQIVLDVASLIAVAVSYLVRDYFELEDEYEKFLELLIDYASLDETKRYLNLIRSLIKKNSSYEEAIFLIGNGSFALESFSQALFVFLKTPRNTEQVILNGANSYGEFSGDTDAIGLLAGVLSGAYNGEDSVPSYLKLKLKNYKEIVSLADRLYEISPHVD